MKNADKHQVLTIGLFGLGVVGSGLVEILSNNDFPGIRLKKVCVKDPEKKRVLGREQLTFNAWDILNDPEINVVVETINGSDDAFGLVTAALRRGKAVITANKKMVAGHFSELLAVQEETGMPLLYESAACGGIPIIRTLEEHFASEPVEGISGIFNGTSNYILSNMFRDGKSFEAALSDAQRLGFAELDPSSDVDGDDAKYKLILLAAHSLGIVARPSDVLNLGIRHLRQEDIVFARQRHGKIKLTPVSKRLEGHCLALYVLPSLVNEDHFLYHVENEFNGVEIYGTYSGVQHLKGRGAGSMPTGSALLSDLHALKQGYRYTYRKKKVNGHSVLEQDHKLFVYVRVPQQVPVDALPVSDIRIIDKSADTYAVVGWSTPQWLLEKKSWLEKQTAFVMQLPQNAV